MPKLSIITINFNNYAGLQKTMDSVLAQTFDDYEYIIIDGGSADGSKDVIERQRNKLSYWISEKDNGIFNAMNKGILKSNGEYLMFMNSGDVLHSTETIKHIFERSNKEDIIYGNAMVERGKGNENEVKTYPARLTFKFFRNHALHHNSSIIKARLFEKLGLYNEDFKIMSDWEFFARAICLNQASYKYLDMIVCCFNADGISSLISSGPLKLTERQVVLNKYFNAILPDLLEVEKEKDMAVGRLRLYQSSRLHRIVEKLISNRFYKFLKNY